MSTDRLQLNFDGVDGPRELKQARGALSCFLTDHQYNPAQIDDILIAATEAINNVFRHNNPPPAFTLLLSAREDLFSLMITDRGMGFDLPGYVESRPCWTQDCEGGRGFPIMATLMETCCVASTHLGTVVHLTTHRGHVVDKMAFLQMEFKNNTLRLWLGQTDG